MKLRGFRAISQSFALIPRDMSLASPTISLSLPLSHFLVQRDETRLDETRHASTAGVTHFHSIIVRSCSRFGKFAPAKSRSNLSLSLSATRTKRIDRSIDTSRIQDESKYRERIGMDGKLAVRELDGFSPVYILSFSLPFGRIFVKI